MSSETSRYGRGWSNDTVIPLSMRAAVAPRRHLHRVEIDSPRTAHGRRAARGMAQPAGRSAKVEGSRGWRIGREYGGSVFAARRFPPSKFHAPSAPSRLVRRSRLLDALDRGRRARLTLVVGSPGAGKTALLADWLAAHPERPTAWLEL